jgi:hypothetical protein
MRASTRQLNWRAKGGQVGDELAVRARALPRIPNPTQPNPTHTAARSDNKAGGSGRHAPLSWHGPCHALLYTGAA